jgi:GH35 family endo-1,4-beta-xylanase
MSRKNTLIRINFIYCRILILLLVAMNANAQLVTNGSFEATEPGVVTDLSAGIDGWLLQIMDGAAADFQIVVDTAQHGNRSLKIVANTSGSNQWSIQALADSISVAPGASYNYSVWAKAEKPGAQVNFTVGNYSYSEYGAIRPATLTTEWKEFTLEFTITDNQTIIRAPIHFNYAANVGKAIYIDNLVIKDAPGNVWEGPPLASKQPKFVGNIYSPAQVNNFEAYWNQVTPENAGKWGYVEGTRDVMNWGGLDAAYNLAKDNDFPFRFHVLVRGVETPTWIDTLEPAEQLEEIREWFEAVAERYDDIDYLEVVNEGLPGHNPPDGNNGRVNYKEALSGDGETGWDWILNSFRMAREIFPQSTKLMINDYNIMNSTSNTAQYLKIIRLLQSENLIDAIGEQGHAGQTDAPVVTMKRNLDSLASTGLPIQITEFDVRGFSDAIQLQNYQKLFLAFYEHPGVEGITLWGWRAPMYIQDAYLINQNGSERPALEWLRQYLDTLNLKPVSVEEIMETPLEFCLYDNYPNPFNFSTQIQYSIPQSGYISLKVYNLLGEEIMTLFEGFQQVGSHVTSFDGTDLASGVYLYQLKARQTNSGQENNLVETKKFILLK